MKKKVVGLGEVLWDHLPGRTCLGGAPANFAYITTLMGDQGIVASRVGEDSLGLEALRRMEELGLNIDHVQTDRLRPTGSVKVQLDGNGLPHLRLRIPWPGISWSGPRIGSIWQKRRMLYVWIAGTAVRGKPLHHPPFSSSHVSPHRENLRR